jgi:hypothetical protein
MAKKRKLVKLRAVVTILTTSGTISFSVFSLIIKCYYFYCNVRNLVLYRTNKKTDNYWQNTNCKKMYYWNNRFFISIDCLLNTNTINHFKWSENNP